MLLGVIFLCCFATVCVGKSYAPSDILNPMDGGKAVKFCGRPEVARSAICDPDNLISKDSKDAIEGFINLGKSDSEIGVLVIESMASTFVMFRSIDSAAEKFARTVHDSWGVGDKLTNNGVLVFLSIKDRAFFISTGSGVQKVLTGRHIDKVMEHAKPMLRVHDIGRAVEKMVIEIDIILTDPEAAVAKQVLGEFTASASDAAAPTSAPPSSEGTNWGVLGIYIFIFSIFGFIAWQNSRKKYQLEKGQKALDKLMREVEGIREGNRFHCESCPICLDDFPIEFDVRNNEPASVIVSADVLSLETDGGGGGYDGKPASSPPPQQQLSDKRAKTPKRPMALRCGHVFCYDCLSTHLKTSNGKKCPICRENVDGSQGGGAAATAAAAGTGDVVGDAVGGAAAGGSTGNPPSCSASGEDTVHIPTGRYYRQRPPSHWYRHHTPELMYRLNRLRYMYPHVMTDHSYHAMTQAVDRQSFDDFNRAAETRLQEVNTVLTQMREAAKKNGKSGSSRSSFGGGRSSGGRGGRW